MKKSQTEVRSSWGTVVSDLFYRASDAPKAPLPLSASTHRQVWAVATICIVFFWLLYTLTVAPSLGMGHDTGELTTCCVLQGVPHSPGYPLFVCLGWLASQFAPFTQAPYANNLLGAAEVALAMGFLGAALTLATRPMPATLATLLAGTCTAVWRQAVLTEVFSLHLLLLSILLWLAILWELSEDTRRREILLVTSFILGCCLAHQHIIALAAPVFLLYGATAKGKGRSWGFCWLNLPILLLTATLPYALQSYMSQQLPALNWASPTDAKRLWAHFLRRSYGTGLLNSSANAYDERAGDAQVTTYFIALVRSYFPFPSFLFLVMALDNILQTKFRPKVWLFLGIALVYGPFFAILGNQPGLEFYSDMMERFYSSSVLGLAGLAAFGLEWTFYQLKPAYSRYVKLLFLLPLYQTTLNLPKCSERGQYHSVDLVRAYLKCIPPRSALVIGGDMPCGVGEYLREVQNERRDVIMILPGLAGNDWYQERLPIGVALASRKGPPGILTNELALENMLYYLHKRGYSLFVNDIPPGVRGIYTKTGLVQRYVPLDNPQWSTQELTSALKQSFADLEASPRRGDYRLDWRQNYWTRYCIISWINGYREIAKGLVEPDPATACKALDRVIEMEFPANLASYLNRARLLGKLNRLEEAIRDYKVCLLIAPESEEVLTGMIDTQERAGHKDEAKGYLIKLSKIQSTK